MKNLQTIIQKCNLTLDEVKIKSFVQIDKEKKGDYLNLLTTVSNLSGLFSDNISPYINYRLAENIFCKCFNAKNLSRSDTAFDAKYESIGVGLKTFVCRTNFSLQKIAEFNSSSEELKKLKGKKLALKVSEYRNKRIDSAIETYKIITTIYHIVARSDKELIIFETEYNRIDISKIKILSTNKTTLKFSDGKNTYSYYYSKSTLYMKFDIPNDAFRFKIEILDDPYKLLKEISKSKNTHEIAKNKLVPGENYVILPLFSTKNLNIKKVAEASGLNAWNAKPRPNQEKRDYGEMYIPIPSFIRNKYPDFFPSRGKKFKIKIPTDQEFSAKICQENSKALMTKPNKALENWLLRDLMNLKQGELATIEKLNILGFDSLIVYKDSEFVYRIDKALIGSYENFIKL